MRAQCWPSRSGEPGWQNQMSDSPVSWQQYEPGSVPLHNEPALPPQPYSLPLPNAVLRAASSVSEIHVFFAIGEAWAQLVSHFLQENPLVLDIGCGCGKLARFLYMNPGL